jgi:hypothetical protein
MHGVVCAGALAHPGLRALGIERVPLLQVQGETILARTIRCLRDGGGCRAVHVLAPPELPLPDLPGVAYAPYTGRLISDGIAFVRDQVQDDYLLVAGGDCALLTPECITALVTEGLKLEADFVYPAVRRAVAEARFPGGKRTYRRFRDGTVTGGNVFLVRRQYIVGAEPWLTELFARRKNPLAMGQLFGLGFLLLLIAGNAPLSLVEARVGRALRGKFRALLLDYPEIAVDIDKPADYLLLKSELDRLPAGGSAS